MAEVKLTGLPGLDTASVRELAERAARAVFQVKVLSLMSQVWGSGFLVAEGLVTAKHVLAPALVEGTADLVPGTVIKVTPVEDGTKSIPATVKLVATDYDVALLEASVDQSPLPWGDSDAIKEGDPVLVLAMPQTIEEGLTVYAGLGQVVSTSTVDPLIFRYSVPVQPGSSGGVVLNLRGEVIGINLLQEKFGDRLMGDGLKANVIRRVLHGEPVEPWGFEVMKTTITWPELATLGLSFALGLALFERR